jgi:hypothetical protein
VCEALGGVEIASSCEQPRAHAPPPNLRIEVVLQSPARGKIDPPFGLVSPALFVKRVGERRHHTDEMTPVRHSLQNLARGAQHLLRGAGIARQ